MCSAARPGSRINYGDYFVLDLNAGLRFGADKRHRLSLRLENALDETYASRVRTGETDGGDYLRLFVPGYAAHAARELRLRVLAGRAGCCGYCCSSTATSP